MNDLSNKPEGEKPEEDEMAGEDDEAGADDAAREAGA